LTMRRRPRMKTPGRAEFPRRLEFFDPEDWPADLHEALARWTAERNQWMDFHPGSVDVVEAIRQQRQVRLWVVEQTAAGRGTRNG
jgi:hypothetical protein